MKKLILLCISLLFLQTPLAAMNYNKYQPKPDTSWERIAYNGSLFAFGVLTTAAVGVGALVADKYLNGKVPASKALSCILGIPSLLVGYASSMTVTLPIAKRAKQSAEKKGEIFNNKKIMFAGAAVGAAFSALCFYGLYQK